MSIVYISLGSNLGDRAGNIKKTVEELSADKKLKIREKSAVYETEPVGGSPQDYFLNQVIGIETNLTPHDLLRSLLEIERKLGRKRGIRWGERLIDLDILLFDDLILKEFDLEIPHPRLFRRKFVLVPLAEINPELYHPVLRKKITDIVKDLKDNKNVCFYNEVRT